MTIRKTSDWVGVIAAYALVIAVNAAANIVPIAGKNAGEVSDLYFSLFTPAGYTFGIWGVIYLMLGCYAVYQALPAQRDSERLARISRLFIANCVLNSAWIFAWHYEFISVTLLLMAAILYTLIRIYQQLSIGSAAAGWSEKLFLNVPFSLYTGWITVATIANISVLQAAVGANDLWPGEINWTFLKLAVAGAIGATMVIRKLDFVFVLVIAWAAFGIANGQPGSPAVVGAAVTLGCVALLLALAEIGRRTVRRP
jgi:hypothetical protein